MAKISIIEREKKRKFLVKRFAFVRNKLKNNIISSDNFNKKFLYQSLLQKLPRNSSFSRLALLYLNFKLFQFLFPS
jgi:hypothetical protein